MSKSKHTAELWRHVLDISEDEREAYRFDDTVQFGFGYDWDSYETSCQVAQLPSGQRYKVWRIGDQWSLYGGDLGFYEQGLPSAEAAKKECEKIDAPYAEERARLIAAAPDMLAALKKVRQSLDDITDLESACRSGGPDPMDLQALSENLSEAVLIAVQLDDEVAKVLSKAEGGE